MGTKKSSKNTRRGTPKKQRRPNLKALAAEISALPAKTSAEPIEVLKLLRILELPIDAVVFPSVRSAVTWEWETRRVDLLVAADDGAGNAWIAIMAGAAVHQILGCGAEVHFTWRNS
jgi:hypothetical protein